MDGVKIIFVWFFSLILLIGVVTGISMLPEVIKNTHPLILICFGAFLNFAYLDYKIYSEKVDRILKDIDDPLERMIELRRL